MNLLTKKNDEIIYLNVSVRLGFNEIREMNREIKAISKELKNLNINNIEITEILEKLENGINKLLEKNKMSLKLGKESLKQL